MEFFQNDCMAGNSIGKNTPWEPHLVDFVRSYTKLLGCQAIVDVGANFGYHSMQFSRILGPEGRVFSFEPQSQNYELLMRNIAHNSIANITPFNKACSSSRATVSMPLITDTTTVVNMGDFTLNQTGAASATTDVEAVPLDSMAFPPIGLMKIDVQGWELSVLQGAKELLQKDRPTLIIEFEEYQLAKTGTTCKNVIDYLRSIGYYIFFLDYEYPSDHICVHRSRLAEFTNAFKPSIQPHTAMNMVNRNILYGIDLKICMSLASLLLDSQRQTQRQAQKQTIAFFLRHLTLRGTEIAAYDYADCNETLLGNTSIILLFSKEMYRAYGLECNDAVYEKFTKRFTCYTISSYSDIPQVCKDKGINLFYTITHGNVAHQGKPFGLVDGVRTFTHCVFDTTTPFGSIYSPISESLNTKYSTKYPVLPHMIRIHDTQDTLREELGIPANAIVFGRYGGDDTFNIDFVKACVRELCAEAPNIYWVYMNTPKFVDSPRARFLHSTTDSYRKRAFINTCDAMLHARNEGETFGLSCGEFALCGKPVITYSGSQDKAHIDILGEKAILYSNKDSLKSTLLQFHPTKYSMDGNGYMAYSPEAVMDIFKNLITPV